MLIRAVFDFEAYILLNFSRYRNTGIGKILVQCYCKCKSHFSNFDIS